MIIIEKRSREITDNKTDQKISLITSLNLILKQIFQSDLDVEQKKSVAESKILTCINDYLVINDNTLSTNEKKYIHKWLKELGISTKTRFICFPYIGWQLIKFDEQLNFAVNNFIEERGTNKILKLLYIFTDLLNFQITERPYYLTTPPIEQIKVDGKDAIPKNLIGKKIIIKNFKSINFDKTKGYDPKAFLIDKRVPTVPNTFEKYFLNHFEHNLAKKNRNRFFKGLIIQLKEFLPDYNWNSKRIAYTLSRIIFTSKFNETEIKNLLIRVFYDHYYYGNVSQCLKYDLRSKHKKIFNYLEKHYILTNGIYPSHKDIRFIITVSSLGSGVLNFVKNIQKVKTVGKAYDLLEKPRTVNTHITNTIISSKSVLKSGLRVNTSVSKSKFMKEDNPYGVTNYVLAAFQDKRLRKFITQNFSGFKLLEKGNLELEFTGQIRGKKAYSPIYEDAVIKENSSTGVQRSISILVKRTDYERPERYLIDWLKAMTNPKDDDRIYTLVNVTHPSDVNITNLTSSVARELQGTSCGIIDIGIFEGFKGYKNLGVIFGALEQARRNGASNFVNFAFQFLQEFRIGFITKDQLTEFNKIYLNAGITQNLRQENYKGILRFLKEWSKTYSSYLSSSKDSREHDY